MKIDHKYSFFYIHIEKDPSIPPEKTQANKLGMFYYLIIMPDYIIIMSFCPRLSPPSPPPTLRKHSS